MPHKKPKCEHKCSFHFSSLIEEELESHRANTGSTAPRNDLPRQEGKPSGAPFEVQLPEIHWQPTFKESRCFLPSAWPPSFPGSWADLATLCPAVCELWQPVQVRDREVVEKGGGGRAVGGRRVASPVAPGQRGCWVSLEPTLSMSVKDQASKGIIIQLHYKATSERPEGSPIHNLQKLTESQMYSCKDGPVASENSLISAQGCRGQS